MKGLNRCKQIFIGEHITRWYLWMMERKGVMESDSHIYTQLSCSLKPWPVCISFASQRALWNVWLERVVIDCVYESGLSLWQKTKLRIWSICFLIFCIYYVCVLCVCFPVLDATTALLSVIQYSFSIANSSSSALNWRRKAWIMKKGIND